MTVIPRHYSTKLSACLPPALPMPGPSGKLLVILLWHLCLSAVLSIYLPAFLQPYIGPASQAACCSSVKALPQWFYQTMPASLQPCLSICLLIFYDSSASALFYQPICLPSSSHTHPLPVCKAARLSSMTALPQRCSIKLSVCLSQAFTHALPVCKAAYLSSMTALPQRCSIKLYACLPPALPMPWLSGKLLAILLWQLCLSAVLPNYLPVFLQPYPCALSIRLLVILLHAIFHMTALPLHKFFIWYQNSCLSPTLPVNLSSCL
jgi:hypothetical protein